MKSFQYLKGRRFGKNFVLDFLGTGTLKRKHHIFWLVRCDCGLKRVTKHVDLCRGHANSCGRRQFHRKPDAPINVIFCTYKNNAKNRKIPFTLSKKQFKILITQNCTYCGDKPNNRFDREFYNLLIYGGIDRKDNKFGYSVKNCVPCCKMCNVAKNNYSTEEFVSWIKRLKRNFK